jgi:hypothetical protein
MAFGKGVALDHLVYAVRDLEAGIASIERLIGIRATPGGKHTGRGTHNAVVSLGSGSYLEIVATDPEQPSPEWPRAFGLDTLHEPRLVTWAVRVQDIEKRAAHAVAAGYDPGPVVPMSRALPGGGELRWRLTLPQKRAGDGLVPFLIQWEPGAIHPSETATSGAMLVELEGEHPHADAVQPLLDAIGVHLQVTEAARPALTATIEGPNGTVLLS